MKSLLKTFTLNPYRIFLVDGIGALLSAVLLLLLLAPLETFFGMPRLIVFILAGIAVLLMCGSLACYFIKPNNWRTSLKLIIAANISYACTTLTLVLIYNDQLTVWGWLYFLLEVMVLAVLATLELQVHTAGSNH